MEFVQSWYVLLFEQHIWQQSMLYGLQIAQTAEECDAMMI